MKNIVIGQAGGPTAVINASLAGFVAGVAGTAQVYAAFNGYQGLVEDDILHLDSDLLNGISEYADVPGACLGSGRYQFTEDRIKIAVRNLRIRNIDSLVFIGGNGTMAALSRVRAEAEAIGYDLQVIGIPKTVDNDLGMTDHAPGFGSAAKYVSLATRDISRDLAAMKNFEQVRIIETMGRNAGWLAKASGFLKNNEEEGPHLIYIPERKLHRQHFINEVSSLVKEYGFATVVVSEGVMIEGEDQIEQAFVKGRSVLGGISKELERFVRDELGVMARSENLGMSQRSSSAAVSSQDRKEAYEAGMKAAELCKHEITGEMVTIERLAQEGYHYKMSSCSLESVASEGERLLPPLFIKDSQKYYEWLSGIIGDELKPYPPELKGRLGNVQKPVGWI